MNNKSNKYIRREEMSMAKEKQVTLMLTLPKHYRDALRTMAAAQNLKNPDQVTSAAEIAKDIILKNIEVVKETEDSL
jgi:hypothetical protein